MDFIFISYYCTINITLCLLLFAQLILIYYGELYWIAYILIFHFLFWSLHMLLFYVFTLNHVFHYLNGQLAFFFFSTNSFITIISINTIDVLTLLMMAMASAERNRGYRTSSLTILSNTSSSSSPGNGDCDTHGNIIKDRKRQIQDSRGISSNLFWLATQETTQDPRSQLGNSCFVFVFVINWCLS